MNITDFDVPLLSLSIITILLGLYYFLNPEKFKIGEGFGNMPITIAAGYDKGIKIAKWWSGFIVTMGLIILFVSYKI